MCRRVAGVKPRAQRMKHQATRGNCTPGTPCAWQVFTNSAATSFDSCHNQPHTPTPTLYVWTEIGRQSGKGSELRGNCCSLVCSVPVWPSGCGVVQEGEQQTVTLLQRRPMAKSHKHQQFLDSDCCETRTAEEVQIDGLQGNHRTALQHLLSKRRLLQCVPERYSVHTGFRSFVAFGLPHTEPLVQSRISQSKRTWQCTKMTYLQLVLHILGSIKHAY